MKDLFKTGCAYLGVGSVRAMGKLHAKLLAGDLKTDGPEVSIYVTRSHMRRKTSRKSPAILKFLLWRQGVSLTHIGCVFLLFIEGTPPKGVASKGTKRRFTLCLVSLFLSHIHMRIAS